MGFDFLVSHLAQFFDLFWLGLGVGLLGAKKPPQKCGGSGWIVETDTASTEWPSVNVHQISMSQKHCVQVRR